MCVWEGEEGGGRGVRGRGREGVLVSVRWSDMVGCGGGGKDGTRQWRNNQSLTQELWQHVTERWWHTIGPKTVVGAVGVVAQSVGWYGGGAWAGCEVLVGRG